MEILGMLFGFFVAIIPHEVAHAWVAYRLGDPTAKQAHRLTLNPLAHVDLIGTVLLPLFLMLMNSWRVARSFNPYFTRRPERACRFGWAGYQYPARGVCHGYSIRAMSTWKHLTILVMPALTNLFLCLFNLILIPR